MKLSKLINEDQKYFGSKQDELNENPVTDDEKKSFLETVQNFSSYGDKLKQQVDLVELAEQLSNTVNMAERIILSEKEDWFDKITIKRNTSEMKKLVSEATKTASEAKSLHERLISLYEDCNHILGRYFETKKEEPKYNEMQLHGEQSIHEEKGVPFKSKASNQRYSMSGPMSAKLFHDKLAKKISPEYAAGVYEAAISMDYTSKNASDAYDDYGDKFEKDVQQMDRLLNK